jgi:Spy/CpxP family protein refolding chaperone
MNGRNLFLVSGLVLALLMINVIPSPAADQTNAGAAIARAKIAQLFGAGQFLKELNITPDQKEQIKTILVGNKTQIQTAVRDLVKGRLDLINGAPNAANELANAFAQTATLRKQIFEQIKSILTPDQLAKVQGMQQLKTQRLQKLLEQLNSRIGA